MKWYFNAVSYNGSSRSKQLYTILKCLWHKNQKRQRLKLNKLKTNSILISNNNKNVTTINACYHHCDVHRRWTSQNAQILRQAVSYPPAVAFVLPSPSFGSITTDPPPSFFKKNKSKNQSYSKITRSSRNIAQRKSTSSARLRRLLPRRSRSLQQSGYILQKRYGIVLHG